MSSDEMIEFITQQKTEAEKALKFRVDSERVWRTATRKSWRAVGCNKIKAERRAASEMEARIAIKCRRRVALFGAVLKELLKAAPPKSPATSVG